MWYPEKYTYDICSISAINTYSDPNHEETPEKPKLRKIPQVLKKVTIMKDKAYASLKKTKDTGQLNAKHDPGLDSVSRKNDIKDISEIMDKYKMCITKVIISMLNFLNLIAVLGSINNILILWKCTLKF